MCGKGEGVESEPLAVARGELTPVIGLPGRRAEGQMARTPPAQAIPPRRARIEAAARAQVPRLGVTPTSALPVRRRAS